LDLPEGFMRNCVPGRTVIDWFAPVEMSRLMFKLPGSLPFASSTHPLLPAGAVGLTLVGGEVAMGKALVIRQTVEKQEN
jgi:hypothetical protein